MKGKKFDKDKAPMDLLSNHALIKTANVFGYGAKKYGRFNYHGGMDWSRIISAAYRHLGAFNYGDDIDMESRQCHVAHLAACAFMLMDHILEHKNLDDRRKSIDKAKKPAKVTNNRRKTSKKIRS